MTMPRKTGDIMLARLLTEVEQSILDLLQSEAKVICVQPGDDGFQELFNDNSQEVPRQMTGVHLAAYFGLRE